MEESERRRQTAEAEESERASKTERIRSSIPLREPGSGTAESLPLAYLKSIKLTYFVWLENLVFNLCLQVERGEKENKKLPCFGLNG